MHTDRTVTHNRPDILVLDLKRRRADIIDVGVPLDDDMQRTCAEKLRKYQDLAMELGDLYGLEEVRVVPVILSVNGLVPVSTIEAVEKLGLEKSIIDAAQESVILDTARIVRKVLGMA